MCLSIFQFNFSKGPQKFLNCVVLMFRKLLQYSSDSTRTFKIFPGRTPDPPPLLSHPPNQDFWIHPWNEKYSGKTELPPPQKKDTLPYAYVLWNNTYMSNCKEKFQSWQKWHCDLRLLHKIWRHFFPYSIIFSAIFGKFKITNFSICVKFCKNTISVTLNSVWHSV